MELLALDQTVRDYLWTQLGTISELARSLAPSLLAGGLLSLACAAVLSCCWGYWRTGPR